MNKYTLSISDAQNELGKLPEQFDEDSTPVTVTQDGKPVMVILPFADYERFAAIDSLLETIEILEDKELMAAFREGVQELAEGKSVLWEEVKRELGWDDEESQ